MTKPTATSRSGKRYQTDSEYRERKKAAERERYAARRGKVPTHTTAEGCAPLFHVKGESIMYAADGSVAAKWVKTQADSDAAAQAILDAFKQAAAAIDPLPPTPAPAEPLVDDLLAVYPMGDPHLGMYAWATETLDASFDIAIAERELYGAIDRLVTMAPPARTALVVNLGDFFHADNIDGVTARSGHRLDTDGRYAKIIAAGVNVSVRQIRRALERHDRVIWRGAIGNHDDQNALWLALALLQRFADEPRVEIVTSPAAFWYHLFGQCLLGVTHGHTVKRSGPSLAEIMAHDVPDLWAAARHRHWLVGHVHTWSSHERPGVTIETFRTTAPRDAWTASMGYRSGQDMNVDTWHREWGRVSRSTIGINELRARLAR